MAQIIPQHTVMISPYRRLALALSARRAPIFWAVMAEIADKKAEGTRNMNPISFYTMPTAAEAINPLLLAITVITIKAT